MQEGGETYTKYTMEQKGRGITDRTRTGLLLSSMILGSINKKVLDCDQYLATLTQWGLSIKTSIKREEIFTLLEATNSSKAKSEN